MALAITAVLGSCSGSSATTTSTALPSTTTAAPSTSATTTSRPTTTTAPMPTASTLPATTTTIPVRWHPPLSDPGEPELSILFSLPAGDGGITYTGGRSDEPLTGPQALAVADDGSIWIADTEGRRLLLVTDGEIALDIDTTADGVGPLIDVAASADGVWGLEAVPALDRYRLVWYSLDGALIETFELPAGLHLQDGLTGIAVGYDDALWVELEAGLRVFAAFPEGSFAPREAEGYETSLGTSAALATVEGYARFAIHDVIVSLPIEMYGSLTYEGAKDGSIALMLSDVSEVDATLVVDISCIYFDSTGEPQAVATYPLDEVSTLGYVPRDFIDVAPDGRLIAMVPRTDGVDIVSLNLFPAAP